MQPSTQLPPSTQPPTAKRVTAGKSDDGGSDSDDDDRPLQQQQQQERALRAQPGRTFGASSTVNSKPVLQNSRNPKASQPTADYSNSNSDIAETNPLATLHTKTDQAKPTASGKEKVSGSDEGKAKARAMAKATVGESGKAPAAEAAGTKVSATT